MGWTVSRISDQVGRLQSFRLELAMTTEKVNTREGWRTSPGSCWTWWYRCKFHFIRIRGFQTHMRFEKTTPFTVDCGRSNEISEVSNARIGIPTQCVLWRNSQIRVSWRLHTYNYGISRIARRDKPFVDEGTSIQKSKFLGFRNCHVEQSDSLKSARKRDAITWVASFPHAISARKCKARGCNKVWILLHLSTFLTNFPTTASSTSSSIIDTAAQ